MQTGIEFISSATVKSYDQVRQALSRLCAVAETASPRPGAGETIVLTERWSVLAMGAGSSLEDEREDSSAGGGLNVARVVAHVDACSPRPAVKPMLAGDQILAALVLSWLAIVAVSRHLASFGRRPESV